MAKRRTSRFECPFCGEPLQNEIDVAGHRCDQMLPFEMLFRRSVSAALSAYSDRAQQAQQKNREQQEREEALRKAAEFISRYSGVNVDTILSYKDDFENAYRQAALKCHPDHPELGGTNELFIALKQAADLLRKVRFA